MTSCTTFTTFGESFADLPTHAGVLRRHGLDFCSDERLALEAACHWSRLDAEAERSVPIQHRDSGAGSSVEDMTLTELCDHVEQTHHANMLAELARLGAMFRKVANAYGVSHPWVHHMVPVFDVLDSDLRQHMVKEERVLFPLIRGIETSDRAAILSTLNLASPISVLEHEHEAAGLALVRLRTLSNGFTAPAGACSTFLDLLDSLRELEVDMRWRVDMENNVLFPRAVALAVSELTR